ncbi:hypothetical protein FOQG_07469 [Fusarium oxysporum f. sp. raphani 54005]|uniref:Uncharacterized protein n=3 Tax=Fusarium oxysporum TaxID=5507 RepID=X0C7E2_FUSOX|nr:hypothetical protein FOVG_01306 [Fusarium oxysporum f. sp. pisi HDV247]EXK90066.1 hypothetical protein FOQG_07469 [Fusarium oxysporum f. sp. raphani 54005]EXL83713.1 hypothetical protein FOPG_03779 [Fusarium oxysporum f. sp. conglutinans race 2 54008]KAK2696031.1 hypothetical protein QWA68_006239 [Fusarium oxysporum]WKT38927.1 hypothetical protein QSH57_000746 [Fusarium oxysporum f. sp. vasinfectum]
MSAHTSIGEVLREHGSKLAATSHINDSATAASLSQILAVDYPAARG